MTDAMEQRERDQLVEFATLLLSCRDVFLALDEQGLLGPNSAAPRSKAWRDFRTVPHGPAGPWPADFVRQPQRTAVTLLRQQADFCTAMGVLVSVAEVHDPVDCLLRSVVEYGSRGCWLLDPNPRVDIRVRCIRAYLMELASLYHSRSAYKLKPNDAQAAYNKASKDRFRKAKKTAAQLFHPKDSSLANDPGQWTIEGNQYMGWTDITEKWAKACAPGVDGEALYQLLAVRAHPQGFTATVGLTFAGDGQVTRVVTVEEVETQVRLAIISFYTALTSVTNYHGRRPQLLVDWKDEVLRVLPGLLPTSKAAEQPADR